MSHLLIVEDSPTQAERLRLILEAADFDAEIAPNAEAALVRLAAAPFDIVISDIVMPGLSGYELCRKIKANPEWKNIPVILLTTRKDPMDLFLGLECGADNFYTKPYDPERLIERVRNILLNRSLRAQGKLKVGIEISLFGKTFVIGSGREQILDLLIATFEDIVHANRDLERSQEELAEAKRKIEGYARRLEGRVRSSEEMYRAIVEGVTDGIITVDETGMINSLNPAAKRIFGYEGEDAIGRNIFDLMTGGQAEKPTTDLLRKASSHRGMQETTGRRKDGSTFPIELDIGEVAIGDRRLFVAVIADLTVKKQTEEKLRQAQKMEAVGQLTGGIAHDFNNILGVVVGNLDELLEICGDDPTGKLIATSAMDAAMRGAELIRRLLAFSRTQPLQPTSLDLDHVLREMEPLLRRSLGERITIEIRSRDDVWPVMADKGQLENAVLNLAINARDAMPNGGKLTISWRNVVIDDAAAATGELPVGEFAMVAVTDSGTGIPPETLSRVFEPFFTTKEVGKGSGLGLSMVFGFTRQSGGTVKIYSEVGHGTEVRLYLPRASAPANELGDNRGAMPNPTGHERVLVVEDKVDVRQMAVRLLQSLGYRPVEAADPASALAILERDSAFDLVFTDLVMPGKITGIDLARNVMERFPSIAVLATSGFSAPATLGTEAGTLGITVVSKPYRKAELAQHLRAALDLRDERRLAR